MKKLFVISFLSVLGLGINAQDYSWRLTYDVSIPLGEFSSEYISAASWRGIGVDNRWMMADKVSVGFNASWHTFYERKPNVLATSSDGLISAYGTQFRYLNAYAFQANAHYYLGEQGQINPWVGLSVGTTYSEERTELGLVAFSFKPWSFAVSPQIGVDVPISISTDFTLGVRYNAFFNNENQARFDYTYLTINAGFKFTPF